MNEAHHPQDPPLVDRQAILNARQHIATALHRTPIASSAFLSDRLGVRLSLKLELFQKTGSFKPRGVLNKLMHLSADERRKGVISLSAGNHAQAVSWAASRFGVASTLVMPQGSLQSKIDATRGYGGEVILTAENLLDTCLMIQRERDLTLIHPFDDPLVIAGQGTVGLEIIEDLPAVDVVVVGIGGGGLISGIATAIKTLNPYVKIIGVEPTGACAMSQSLEGGSPVHLNKVNTIADGLAAPFAGHHTLRHVQKYVDQVVTVDDREIAEAVKLIIERCKVIAEPAAAAGLAALLTDKIDLIPEQSILCVLSGGNLDIARLESLKTVR